MLKASVFGFIAQYQTIKASLSSQVAGTKVSEDLLYEFVDAGDFIRIFETRRVRDPEVPDRYAGINFERYFDSNLCVYQDPVSFRQTGIIQDVTSEINLVFSCGIKPDNASDPIETATNFGSGLVVADINDGAGEDNTTVGLSLQGETVFSAFKSDTSSTVIISDFDGSSVLNMEDDLFTLNGNEVSLKEHLQTANGSYTIERTPNGAVLQIDMYILHVPVAGGTQTVTLPAALPDSDESKVTIELTATVPSEVSLAAASYISGTLTTTTLQFSTFDGSTFSDDPVYVRLTWKP